MGQNIPINEEVSLQWAAIAHGARIMNHALRSIEDPAIGSNFDQINSVYSSEKASDWHRSYLTAALDHLMVWADIAAPLKFHPEQEVVFTFRPAQTLARAAMEAASQAVWLSSGDTAQECARRHLSLIRWDYVEHRKSSPSSALKERMAKMDEALLERASGTFEESELIPPNHLTVLRAASKAAELDPGEVESVWRAASGAAHGRAWPAVALQHVLPLEEYESGHFRTLRFPDPAPITRALDVADRLTSYGVLRHADFCNVDIPAMLENARVWLAGVVPLREDADPAVVEHLKQRKSESK